MHNNEGFIGYVYILRGTQLAEIFGEESTRFEGILLSEGVCLQTECGVKRS